MTDSDGWAEGHETMNGKVQDAPVQDGSEPAPNEDRLAGVVAQVRSDVGVDNTSESILALLTERVRETGVEVDPEELRRLADEIAAGE